MQNILFTVLQVVFFLLVVFNSSAQGVWTQKADYSAGNTNFAVGFSIGTKGYIGTGRDSAFALTNSFWEYDPATDNWMQKADFAGAPRSGAVGFSIGSKGYVGTGNSSSVFLNDFWEYDPATDVWTQKANFGGSPRHYATGFSIGGKGYFGTGNAEITDLPTRDFWEYDPSINSWTQMANMPVGKCSATGFSLSGKGYIGTGVDSVAGFPVSKNFWEYDPLFNTWTQKADYAGTARKHAVAFSIGTKGYLGTGIYNKDFQEFDPNAVGVNELKEELAISIYPNPLNESAVIQMKPISSKKNIAIEFVLYDLNGKELRRVTLKTLEYKFYRNELPSGIYIYNFLSEKKVFAEGKLFIL